MTFLAYDCASRFVRSLGSERGLILQRVRQAVSWAEGSALVRLSRAAVSISSATAWGRASSRLLRLEAREQWNYYRQPRLQKTTLRDLSIPSQMMYCSNLQPRSEQRFYSLPISGLRRVWMSACCPSKRHRLESRTWLLRRQSHQTSKNHHRRSRLRSEWKIVCLVCPKQLEFVALSELP